MTHDAQLIDSFHSKYYTVLCSKMIMVLIVFVSSPTVGTDTRYSRKWFYLPPINFPIAFLTPTNPKIEIRIYSTMIFPFRQG